MKRLAFVFLAAAAACSTGPTSVGARLAGPSAIVQFYGVTRNNPGPATSAAGLRAYLAVADARSGDLRILDPSVDQPVLGPGLVYPLSIITLPRPQRLAAASLGDGAAGGADALVSASAGEPVLQVIETWSAQNRVAFSIDLTATLGADAEIQAMVGFNLGSGRGRIVAAATGQRLVVVDFVRNTDGSVALPPETPAPIVQQLTFDATDLALGPDGKTVYAATRDPLGKRPDGSTVYGVEQFDASGDASLPFTVTSLDALAPTVAVAAALVDERTVQAEPCAAEHFVGQPLLRVYALLDPEGPDGCGPDRAIACGLATLDPARAAGDPASGQLALDPAAAATPAASLAGTPAVPAQRFRPPIPVPGVPLHIAIGGAPLKNADPNDPARVTNSASIPSSACPTSSATPLARVFYGTALRLTSALAMVTSSDGRVYWLDLSRFGPVTDTSALVGLGRTEVLTAETDAVGADQWQLGLWYDLVGSTLNGTVVVSALTLPNVIAAWPGFTPTAAWSAVYQGPLPGLQARPGVVAIAPDGSNAWAALQSYVGSDVTSPATWTNAKSWSSTVPVDDPARGVRAAADFPEGDIVTFPDLGCEARVAKIVPGSTTQAGVAFPSGALQLDGVPPCVAAAGSLAVTAAGSWLATQITVLASDVVVSNDVSGYLGRAPISISTAPADGVYTLAWRDEATLAASTDPASREALAVARRARRLFYPTEGPCPLAGATAGTTSALPVSCYTAFPGLADPVAPAPAIRFRLGLRNVTKPSTAPTAADRPPRGVGLHFTTQSGLAQSSRRPVLGGAPPATLVAVDPGDVANHQNDDFHFYVAYQDDQVAWFSSTGTPSQVTSIR